MSKYIEKIFLDDVREKKRTGNGIHSRTGMRGYVGKMLFASDLMSRKEKIKHRKAGKVVSYNMYETILKRDEFEALDIETQKVMLQKWRTDYGIKEIQKGMGIASATFYRYVKEFDLPKVARGKAKKINKKRKAIAITEQKPVEKKDIQASIEQNAIKILTNGMHIEYNGTYEAEQLNKIFTKLQLLTDGEENKFSLSISLTERT